MRYLSYLFAFLALLIFATDAMLWLTAGELASNAGLEFFELVVFMYTLAGGFVWFGCGEIVLREKSLLLRFPVLVSVYAALETLCSLTAPSAPIVRIYHAAPETLAFFTAWSLTSGAGLALAAVHLKRKFGRPALSLAL